MPKYDPETGLPISQYESDVSEAGLPLDPTAAADILADEPEPTPPTDDYDFVRLPGGKVVAVPKSAIHDEPETTTQAIPKTAMAAVVDPHFYVWLADGKVVRVKQSDLPTPAGTNAAFGHWQIDDKVYQIVNIVPVEDIVKGEKA